MSDTKKVHFSHGNLIYNEDWGYQVGAVCIRIEVHTITVETEVSEGINFFLVGLADSAVRESQQRIASALGKFGYRIPGRRIIINMAPAGASGPIYG